MQVFLEAIKFNHDQSSATSDAFNIRRNDDDPEPFSEWNPLPHYSHDDSRAAYAIEKIGANPISIKAKFSCSDPNIAIEVQAVDANPVGPNVLGRVEIATVT